MGSVLPWWRLCVASVPVVFARVLVVQLGGNESWETDWGRLSRCCVLLAITLVTGCGAAVGVVHLADSDLHGGAALGVCANEHRHAVYPLVLLCPFSPFLSGLEYAGLLSLLLRRFLTPSPLTPWLGHRTLTPRDGIRQADLP